MAEEENKHLNEPSRPDVAWQRATLPPELQRSLAVRRLVADMIFVIDREGCYRGFSPGEDAQPLVPPDLFMGKHVNEVLPKDVARLLMTAIESALQSSDIQVVTYELWEGDAFRQYECRIAAAGSDEVVALVRDISARGFHSSRRERLRERGSFEDRCDRAMEGENPFSLNFREFTVLGLMQEGLSEREIARSLGLARSAIEKHVGGILTKMRAASRTEAAIRAIRLGLIPD